MPETGHRPAISVVILNYKGADWMRRCLESLASQTVFSRCQIIVADNASNDGSDRTAQVLMAGWANGLFLQTGSNMGFGAGSNLAVRQATGQYLFFLNPDVWLEPDCLEQLLIHVEQAQAGAAGALVMEYEDDTFQSNGAFAFDFCGFGAAPKRGFVPQRLFSACGFYFLRTDLFRKVGGFDETYFLYGEELDLSWRVQLAGQDIVHVPSARIHHRGAAAVNPKGGTKVVEIRTSDAKRFYANRNHLLTLLKNCQHVLLLLLGPAVAVMFLESLLGLILLRRWSFIQKTFLAALADCWRLRHHVRDQRRRIRTFRRHGDFWMLRFLSWRFNRLYELQRMRRLGLPRVNPR